MKYNTPTVTSAAFPYGPRRIRLQCLGRATEGEGCEVFSGTVSPVVVGGAAVHGIPRPVIWWTLTREDALALADSIRKQAEDMSA